MNALKRQALSAAVICLLAGIVLGLFYPGVPARWVLLGLGGLLLLL